VATFTPPIASKVTPRFDRDAEGRPVPTTAQQRALFKYMRSLDRGVNVYVLSDNSVQTDLAVPIVGGLSTTAVPYPINSWAGHASGPTEGAEGGPFDSPPPYSEQWSGVTGVQVYTSQTLSPYLKYWFAGAHGPYVGISANLVSILTAAGYAAYIT
jgi:hypothetical protein